MSCAEMAEPINLLFGLWTRMGRKKHEFNRIHQVAPMCPHGRAHSRHHTIEPSACGGDAFLCQITLTTCFFVCVWNILGMAERICAKFIRKTCLVPHPRSDEFECQGQRSRSPGTKNALCTVITPRQRRNGTRSLQIMSRTSRRHHSVAAGGGDLGGLRAVYVW